MQGQSRKSRGIEALDDQGDNKYEEVPQVVDEGET